MKIKVKKFQVGGLFTSLAVQYIPTSASTTAGAYAPAIASSEEKSSNSFSSSKDELNIKDVLKVFDNVKGLPVDVLYVLKDFKLMFDDDTLFSFSGRPSYSSLVNYYLNNIGKFNALGHSKELYDEARKELIANNSMDEIAIDRRGRLVVATEDGGLDAVSLKEFKKGSYKPITNRELLDLRLNKLPFGDSIYLDMTGVSMDQVIKKVNAMVHSLGSTEKKLEGYTVKLSDAIKAGLNLLQESPNGLYKTTEYTKDLKEQAELALKAVYNSLTPLEATLLSIHSLTLDPKETLANMIYSRTSITNETKFDYQENLNPDGTKRNEKEVKGIDDIKDNILLLIQSGVGGEVIDMTWRTKEGMDSMGTKGRRYTVLPKDSGPTSLENMLRESGIGGILQSYEGITFGDLSISPDSLKDIMYDGRGGTVAFLPSVTDELGNRRVDLSVLELYKKITESVLEEVNSPAWQKEVASKMKEAGLDLYLTTDDKLDNRRFGLFLMVDAVTTDRIFKGNSQFKLSNFILEESNPDPALVDQMQIALSTNKDKNNYEIDPLDKWSWIDALNGGWDDIYRGTVYLPISANLISGAMFGGTDITRKQGMLLDTDYLNHQTEKFNSFKLVGSETLLQ